MATDTLSDLLQRQEPLAHELEAYVTDVESLGQCLQHPLVYSVPHHPMMNAMVNAQYRHKLEAVRKALLAKDWSRFIFMHEKPYRWDALQQIARRMSHGRFWEMFGDVWVDSENIWQHKDAIRDMLESGRPQRSRIMNDDERSALAAMPESVTIYRGHQRVNADGWSWTLCPKKARWFANRFHQNGRVATRTIQRSEIVAVILRRSEQEVIYIGR